MALAAIGAYERVPAFIRQDATAEDRRMLVRLAERLDEGLGAACDVARLPRSGVGPALALASMDYSSRRFCNTLVLFEVRDPPRLVERLSTFMVEDVGRILRDVTGDGGVEALVPQAISDYEGARCLAIVTIVHRCSAGGCRPVEPAEVADFYRERLGEKRREAVLAERTGRAMSPDSPLACRQMERDKLTRLLGLDPEAGLDLALGWSEASDSSLRGKAVRVLADIPGPRASAGLTRLASDRDSGVAMAAAAALKGR